VASIARDDPSTLPGDDLGGGIRTVASSKSAWGAPGFHRGHEDRSAEGAIIEAPKAPRGVWHWDWCPPPQSTKRYGGAS